MVRINTNTTFTLPFMEACPEQVEKRSILDDALPEEAIYLGSVEAVIENWTSWQVCDDYYIIPLPESDPYDWALFRITWDDNWNAWSWSADARLKGPVKDYRDAAERMIRRQLSEWEYDLRLREYQPYRELLQELRSLGDGWGLGV
jgi:hypothetical protein